MPSPYSYSSLSKFDSCPQYYAHTYVWKTPVPEEVTLDLSMACGSVVHSLLEWAHTQELKKKPVTWEKMEEVLPETWNAMLKEAPQPPSREELNTFVQKSMDTSKWYYETIFSAKREPTIGIEKKLLFPLNPARKQWLIGFLDRVSQPSETKIIIHDYKTGTRKLGEKALATDFQAMLYGSMAAHAYAPLSEIELQWHYLAHQKTVKVKLDPENARAAVQKAQRIAHQIEGHKQVGLFPPKVGWQCNRCEFISKCPAHIKK
jgi:CRISPR/Cas system-associated exonuclease Cas4 (RecB family)